MARPTKPSRSRLMSLRLAVSMVWRAGRKQFVLVMIGQLVAAALLAGQLASLAHILDRVISEPSAELSSFFAPIGLLAGLLIATGCVSTFADSARDMLSELTSRYVADRLIDVASSVDLARFEDPQFHDEYERAATSSEDQSWAVVWGLIGIGTGLVGAAAVVAYLASVSFVLVAIILVGALPIWFVSKTNGSDAYDFAYEMSSNNRERAYVGSLLTQRRAAAETRVLGTTPHLRRRFSSLYDERIGAARTLLRRRARRGMITTVAAAVTGAATALLVVRFTLDGELTVAEVAVAVAAVQQLAVRLSALVNGAANLHQASLFLTELRHLMTEVRPVPCMQPAALATPSSIVLKDMIFSYPGTPRAVLCDISLEIPQGQLVALVGENGSGKTTLAKLFCGLYTPTSGSAVTRSSDGSETPLSDRTHRVAALFQDFLCYQLSAFDNVALGDAERYGDGAAVRAAAKDAGIRAEIEALPFGWDTRLSREYEGGADFSVGQWQRIGLARALFREAALLVLDEPTAALDPRAERRLYDEIRQLAGGRTVLLISHRFSSARMADRILVLKSGVVIEDGPHNDLIRKRGLYAELFNLQASAYGMAD